MSTQQFIPTQNHATFTLVTKGLASTKKPVKYPVNLEKQKALANKRAAENLKAVKLAEKRVIAENKKRYEKVYAKFFGRGGPAWYESLTGDTIKLPKIYQNISYLIDCIQEGIYRENMRKNRMRKEAIRFRKREQIIAMAGIGCVKKNRYRRALVALGTSMWADMDEIKKIYEERDKLNKQGDEKYEVDHIVPIVNDLVCGLHNQFNLQIITKSENASKNNNFFIE